MRCSTWVRVGEDVAGGQHKEDDDEDEKVLASIGAVQLEHLKDTVTHCAFEPRASAVQAKSYVGKRRHHGIKETVKVRQGACEVQGQEEDDQDNKGVYRIL